MDTLRVSELAQQPERLMGYFGNGGAQIVDDDGRLVAEVPPAIAPAPEENEPPVLEEFDWLE